MQIQSIKEGLIYLSAWQFELCNELIQITCFWQLTNSIQFNPFHRKNNPFSASKESENSIRKQSAQFQFIHAKLQLPSEKLQCNLRAEL